MIAGTTEEDPFVRLTNRDRGGSDLFIRRDMIAAIGSYWNGEQKITHVTLINEDIDYEVKESPAEVLALINGKIPLRADQKPAEVVKKNKETKKQWR